MLPRCRSLCWLIYYPAIAVIYHRSVHTTVAFVGSNCLLSIRGTRRQHAKSWVSAPALSYNGYTSSISTEELAKAVLPFMPSEPCRSSSPAESLRKGEWFKLICGASFEDLPAVRNLVVVYTLAGADCIDVAADEAVIEAARDGVLAALAVADAIGTPIRAPWLMMSVNDDEEDPHFRKAVFDPELCPSELGFQSCYPEATKSENDCPRPCEAVCPADAIVFPGSTPPPAQRVDMVADLLANSSRGGVLEPRCYGCGRCIDVCPPGIIRAEKYMRSPAVVQNLLEKVDAVEIHTKGNLERFRQAWRECIADAAAGSLELVAVSFPDLGIDTDLSITAMNAIMEQRNDTGVVVDTMSSDKSLEELEPDVRKPEGDNVKGGKRNHRERPLNIWQTDGRPMSGDIGAGATMACIRLAEKVIATRALPFGEGQHFVQLAGGTNDRTAPKLRELGLIGSPDSIDTKGIGGVAYGGFARKVVGRTLDLLPVDGGSELGVSGGRVEDHPRVLAAALKEAFELISGLKQKRGEQQRLR